MDLTRR